MCGHLFLSVSAFDAPLVLTSIEDARTCLLAVLGNHRTLDLFAFLREWHSLLLLELNFHFIQSLNDLQVVAVRSFEDRFDIEFAGVSNLV
jgi:hypothetical protein